MFLRPHRKHVGGEDYTYWSLVKTIRTARGPRHQFIAHLGKLDHAEAQSARDWLELDHLLDGTAPTATQLALGCPPPPPPAPLWRTGVVHFLRRCVAKVPPGFPRARIRLRADAGYFSGRLVREAENLGLGYVIVAREYRGIKQRAQAARFQALRQGWEVAEFRYTPTGWKKPHRFVVVRRPLPSDPVEAKQLTLFRDHRYAYHVLVTNLGLTPWRVWQFYCPRATIEKDIRELLYDLPLGKIPTEAWVANVGFFQLVLFAYDLAHWFKRLCLPPEYLHATLETVRTDLLVVPARLVRRGGRNVLHLPRDYHHRELFEAAFGKVSKLRVGKKK